jgi:hypothetical protein
MRIFIFFIVCLFATGCATKHFADYAKSKAAISGVKLEVAEMNAAFPTKYRVQFDYSITPYHEKEKMYECGLLFDGIAAGTAYGGKQGNPKCEIKGSKGRADFIALTPYHMEFRDDKDVLSEILAPFRFRISIHQRFNKTSTIVITETEPISEK